VGAAALVQGAAKGRFGRLTHAALENPPDRPWKHIEERTKKGLRPGGFGLMMVRAIADELLYNEAQNEVVFVKYLDA
jgi:anti-sigma regulatory factor (Ser/Thr protein kinase)